MRKLLQWYHAFFLDREVARHHATCMQGRGARDETIGKRGRVVRFRRNGAGYEVCWRYKGHRRAGSPTPAMMC